MVEFFFCVFDELVWPDYGMFMYCEQNSPMWFPAKVSHSDKFLGMRRGSRVKPALPTYHSLTLAYFTRLL